ncbi:MAG: hypothetical protein ACI9U2_004853, partial [Bradymonadia bacterium]
MRARVTGMLAVVVVATALHGCADPPTPVRAPLVLPVTADGPS